MKQRFFQEIAGLAVVALIITACLYNPFEKKPKPVSLISVTDGDSLRLKIDGTETVIRLEGIDAPEMDQPDGTESKDFLSFLITGMPLSVEITGRDRYGRDLAVIRTGDLNVNVEMVDAGHAWHFTKYSKDRNLADAELRARKEKFGLWSTPSPIPPWDWRRK